jgi:hypothetical protein
MVMKIENWTGSADTFTWPNNPLVFDTPIDSNHTITKISYQRHHIVVSGGGLEPKAMVLTGHFNGASKRTSYRSMAKHFQETTLLKKLYWETDKFYLGIGRQAKETNSGGRTNFVDYVATFEAILGILLDDTEATSGTNGGDVTTFVTEITGTVTNGASAVTMTDALGNSISIPAAALSTSDAIVYKLVQMVDSGSGIFVSEYAYVTIQGTQTRQVSTTGGFGLLQLAAGANISTVTTTNLSSVVKKFRNGWSA